MDSAFVTVSVPATGSSRAVAPAAVRMSAGSSADVPVSRRAALAAGAAAAAVLVTSSGDAKAEREYAGVPYLGGAEQVDVNNANIRVYQRFPGMYPTVAGLIVANGPFDSVKDLYNIKGLNDLQISTIKKYEDKLLALPPVPEYEIDKFNNGLYR